MTSSANPHLIHLGFQKTLERSPPAIRISTFSASFSPPKFASSLKISGSEIQRRGCKLRRDLVQIAAMDDDSAAFSSFDEFDDNGGIFGGSILSPSEGEESDTEILIFPSTDVDLPSSSDLLDRSDAVTVAAHRFATLQKRRKRGRIQPGVFINMGLIAFSATLLLLVDWCSWKIVRLPFPSFYLTRPFTISAILASCAGFLYVPLLDSLKIHQIIRIEGPLMHASKKGTPTMGGLFFVPIGITVAKAIAGFSSIEVYGAAAATIAFAAIGLLDDTLSSFKNHNYGLPAQFKFCLQAAVGTWFSFWLDSVDVSSPYSMYTFS